MKNSVQIDSKDYSFYFFPMPLFQRKRIKKTESSIKKIPKLLFFILNCSFYKKSSWFIKKTFLNICYLLPPGKKLEQYVVSQLERFHPCFSGQDLFSVRRDVNSKKLCVTVMDKTRFAEYCCRYPEKKLFAGNVDISRSLPGNASKKKLIAILVFIVGSLSLVAYFEFLSDKKVKQCEITPIQSITTNLEDEMVIQAESKNLRDYKDVCYNGSQTQDFLGECSSKFANKGIVEHLSISVSHKNENECLLKTQLLCRGVLPEHILSCIKGQAENFQISIPTVGYVEKKPLFTVFTEQAVKYHDDLIENNVNTSSVYVKETQGNSDSNFLFNIREAINNSYGEVLCESMLENSISCSIRADYISNLCESVKTLFDSSGYFLQMMEIEKQKDLCLVNIRFNKSAATNAVNAEQKAGEEIRLCLEKISSLFFMPQNKQKKEAVHMEKKQPNVKTGQVKNADGKITVFYKTPEGKMIVEVIGAEE